MVASFSFTGNNSFEKFNVHGFGWLGNAFEDTKKCRLKSLPGNN
jgi:hypothetical protein